MLETYYTVLGVSRTASNAEVKTAFRELILQAHPDVVPNASPYWKKQAEERTKEINEAYGVLSNPEKRRRYDQLLDAHQKTQQGEATSPPNHTTAQAQRPQPTRTPTATPRYSQFSKTVWSIWCLIWGVVWASFMFSLGATTGDTVLAFLMAFASFGWAAWASASFVGRILSKFGVTRLLKQFYVVVGTILLSLFAILVAGADMNGGDSLSRKQMSVQQQNRTVASQPLKAASGLSAFPCERGQKTSPIDGGKCKDAPQSDVKIEQPKQAAEGTARLEDIDEQATAKANGPTPKSGHFSGVYFGTVHNKTANLSATFGVVLQEGLVRSIEGCMGVKPPLSGSGPLVGSTRGSHIEFVVGNINFQGDLRETGIAGSYLVSKSGGLQEVGEFNLERKAVAEYQCVDGVFTAVQKSTKTDAIDFQPESRLPRIFGNATVARWVEIKKLCAFDTGSMPCGYDDGKFGTIANLRQGDRVKTLSSRNRAKDGKDIYKVSTAQGWVGWMDSDNLSLDH